MGRNAMEKITQKRELRNLLSSDVTTMIKSGKMGLSAGHVECLDYSGSITTNDARYLK